MMEQDKAHYSSQAPGSIMLFGEHAVLRGHRALVMAIEPTLSVHWQDRLDGQVIVEALGRRYEMPLGDYRTIDSLSYLKACLESCVKLKPPVKGFEIVVDSNLSMTMGFGSSAALVAAALATMKKALGLDPALDLLKLGLAVIRQVQGRGSGADLAASLYGGLIVYSVEKGVEERLEPLDIDLELIYSGSKKPTSQVLEELERSERESRLDLAAIHEMGAISEKAVQACKAGDIKPLSVLAYQHGECMKRLHLYNEALVDIERRLKLAGVGCKISGSGLGDCMVSFGKYPLALPYSRFLVTLAAKGSLACQ